MYAFYFEEILINFDWNISWEQVLKDWKWSSIAVKEDEIETLAFNGPPAHKERTL